MKEEIIRIIPRCCICGGRFGEGIIDATVNGKKNKICEYCAHENVKFMWE